MNISPFEKHASKYDKWFDDNPLVYESELNSVRALLPYSGKGIEIGVGSGRFASRLGIRHGIEPSLTMANMARKRGIDVIVAKAEEIPEGSNNFDYVLMVTTLCFLEDPIKSFREVYRVLKPEGIFINGFVDKESPIGRLYQQLKDEDPFYRIAKFYSVDDVIALMEKTGFTDFEYNQTIFHSLAEIKEPEPIKQGYGEGSFVVCKCRKPKTF